MANNKVVFFGSTLIDLTEDTVTEETLEEGVTAHGADGEKIVGTGLPNRVRCDVAQNLTEAQKRQARENIGAENLNDSIPDYWKTHIDEKVNDIRVALADAGWNKSAFFWYHDSHWGSNSKMSPVLLKYLEDNTPIKKTNFGGDIVDSEGEYPADMAYLWDWRKAVDDLRNHHSVIGNHDDGVEIDARWTDEEIYSYLLAPEETCDIVRGNYFNYYIDSPSEKTRYLYLDTASKNHVISYDTEGLAFVRETLKSTPENWHIVVIAHSWLEVSYTTNPPSVVGLSYTSGVLLPIFDDYNTRQGEFVDCGAMVEFCIGGHSHVDCDYFSETGIPIIATECDSNYVRSGLSNTSGTINESSVNAIIADYNNMTINVIRIGRGSSRTVNIERITPPAYTNVIPLSVEKDGSAYNGGKGYKTNTRINSSQADVTEAGWCVTGYMEAKNGDVIRLKNCDWRVASSGTDRGCVRYYNANKEYIGMAGTADLISSTVCATQTDDGNVVQFTIPTATGSTGGTVAFFRINCQSLTDDSIITKNEAIV